MWPADRGLTTYEVIVSIAISSIIMVALLRLTTTGFSVSRSTFSQSQAVETSRVQLRRLTTSLRQARQADTGAFAIAEALPQRLVYYSDIDGDGTTERLRYELVGTNLERGIIEPTGVPVSYPAAQEQEAIVATGIRNGATAVFRYFGSSYPADPNPLSPVDESDIRYIEYTLLVDADAADSVQQVSLTSQVQVRNLKDNL
jgi:hypothetical protein